MDTKLIQSIRAAMARLERMAVNADIKSIYQREACLIAESLGEAIAAVDQKSGGNELADVLRPFAHPDLSAHLHGGGGRDTDIVYQRNNAKLRFGDFRKVAAIYEQLTSEQVMQDWCPHCQAYISTEEEHDRIQCAVIATGGKP